VLAGWSAGPRGGRPHARQHGATDLAMLVTRTPANRFDDAGAVPGAHRSGQAGVPWVEVDFQERPQDLVEGIEQLRAAGRTPGP